MIDQRKVQAVADLVATFTDAEQKALLEQLLRQLNTSNHRKELMAMYRRQMDELEAGTGAVYTYNPETGEIDPTPVYKKYRFVSHE